MKRDAFLSTSTTLLLLFLAAGQAAHAQSSRTWVSINGNDGNDCSRLTPCRTLSIALSRTSAAGEIDVLDSGDFGPLTINKSVSLISPGVLGGIQVGSGTAITVNAGASDKIVVRGLTIDGLGTGLNGISFTAGGYLYVENCTINNFGQYGIDFAPASNTGKLFVIETIVRNNGIGATGTGVHAIATAAPGFQATIDGLRTENNVAGLKVENFGVVTVRNSLAANNGFSGFSAVTATGSGALRVVIENSVTTHNGTGGVTASNLATVTLSNVVVTDNQIGLNVSGTLISFGNNRIWGNATDGTPTQTISQE